MTHAELHPLYQQMGEVVRGLRALADTIEMRHAQAEKLYDLTRSDVAALRQDQSDVEEKLDCVICVMQHDLERLRTEAAQNACAIGELVNAVQNLSRPVSEIMALRSRAAGLVLGLGLLGSTLLWLAEPVYRWVIEDHLLRR